MFKPRTAKGKARVLSAVAIFTHENIVSKTTLVIYMPSHNLEPKNLINISNLKGLVRRTSAQPFPSFAPV